MTVQLPAGSRVEAKAASAEFRGVGRLGDVAFEGAHGAIKIDEAASVRLTAHAGDVAVGRLGGPAEISTQKGDIRIAEAVRGTVVLRTQAGDVSVGAAPGVSASLDAGTALRPDPQRAQEHRRRRRRPEHPRDHRLRRHHRPQPLTRRAPIHDQPARLAEPDGAPDHDATRNHHRHRGDEPREGIQGRPGAP